MNPLIILFAIGGAFLLYASIKNQQPLALLKATLGGGTMTNKKG